MLIKNNAAALERSVRQIVQLTEGLTREQAEWKPATDKWSVLEVLGHLYDEERDDFRYRMKSTLEDPKRDWPPIDPVGWAGERDYNQRKLAAAVEAFREEREISLTWLHGLDDSGLDQAYVHPKIGSISAGDLLVSWVAHDLLHLRQIINLLLEYHKLHASPYSTRYASP